MKKEYLPFEEAREFVRGLNLKSVSEWKEYCKSGKKPESIPHHSDAIYKGKGWVSWGDWLGTGRIAIVRNFQFLPFEEAREFVRGLNLKLGSEWKEYCKSGKKPEKIPFHPHKVYKGKGWISMGDWLGTGRIATYNMQYLPFEEAREFVRGLNLKLQIEWKEYCKSGKKPEKIPSNPHSVYESKGWVSLGDWLGTGRVAAKNMQYLQFEEAREFMRGLNLKSQTELRNYYKSGKKPENIPSNPHIVYESKGWVSTEDWLGIDVKRWHNHHITHFLKIIENELKHLEPIELLIIIQQSGAINKLKHDDDFKRLLETNPHTKERDNYVSKLIENYEEDEDDFTDGIEDEKNVLDEEIVSEDNILDFKADIKDDLDYEKDEEPYDIIDELKAFSIDSISTSFDEESIEFLKGFRKQQLWKNLLLDQLNIEKLKNETGGQYFTIIKDEFLQELSEVNDMIIPPGYNFRDKNGTFLPPNLMQKLTAYRTSKFKRYGNWSGSGAGKTLSAILTSRVIESKKNLIITFLPAIDVWEEGIKDSFPDSKIYTRDKDCVFNDTDYNYLILNYETFQLKDSKEYIHKFLKDNDVDFIILDEVQGVKQREEKLCSKRKTIITELLEIAAYKNPNLHVLALSSTPVINNLYEPKALLELLKGVKYDDLKTNATVNNALAVYKQLFLNGIRFIPEYKSTIDTKLVSVDGFHLLHKNTHLPKGAILKMEQMLLLSKLEGIEQFLRKGTMIYSFYVDGIIDVAKKYIEDKGFKVGIYTGDHKDGLKKFKKREIDILIGSSTVATGIDGIQKVCNRIICLTLPWTSSEFDQLKGRVYRQGTNFGEIDIIIPQVDITDDENSVWSWDKKRWDRIKYKKSLADAAVDGIIPNELLPSKEKMYDEVLQRFQQWKQRVEDGDLITIDRERIILFDENQMMKVFVKQSNFDQDDGIKFIQEKTEPIKEVEFVDQTDKENKEKICFPKSTAIEITNEYNQINPNINAKIGTKDNQDSPKMVYLIINFWANIKTKGITYKLAKTQFEDFIKDLQNLYSDKLNHHLKNNKVFPLYKDNVFSVDFPASGLCEKYNKKMYFSIELYLQTLNWDETNQYPLANHGSKSEDRFLFEEVLKIFNLIAEEPVLKSNKHFNLSIDSQNDDEYFEFAPEEKEVQNKSKKVSQDKFVIKKNVIKVIRRDNKIVIHLDENTTMYIENDPKKYKRIKEKYIDKYLQQGYVIEEIKI